MNEISISELADETGFTVTHLGQLVRRGVLPAGRKDGKFRLLPYARCLMILNTHSKNKHWAKTFKRKTWADLL